jgi:hypothetical protein
MLASTSPKKDNLTTIPSPLSYDYLSSARRAAVRTAAATDAPAPVTSGLSERPATAPSDPFLAVKGAMVHKATDGTLAG